MGKEIAFFLAGWFSVAIGFEVAPMYGNIAGVVSFIVLHIWFSRRTKRAIDGAMVSPIERDWSGEEEDKAWAHLQKPPRN